MSNGSGHTVDELYDILFDGSEEQIRAVADWDCEPPVSYGFCPGEFGIRFGIEACRGKMGEDQVPNAVAVFGWRHTYK
jgi:hypothetical protein